jgi:hypothetical protein
VNPFIAKLNERIGYHKDNLALWKSGALLPTEPDEDEVTATIRGLEAAIDALEKAKQDYMILGSPEYKDRVCIGCKATFTPKRAGQMYHDKKCAARVRMGKFRQAAKEATGGKS